MIEKIIQIGKVKTIGLITIFSIIGSVVITFSTLSLFELHLSPENAFIVLLISVLAPLLISPVILWYIIGMLIKTHDLETEMREISSIDNLTGTMTRASFLSSCETIYQLEKRNNSCLSFAYIDLDNFKHINDSFGHAAGDEVLEYFGLILEKCIRKSDLAGRLGGEEFALALPGTNLQGAFEITEKLRLLAKNTKVKFDDSTIRFTISIGIAVYNQNNPVELEQLIRQADQALDTAKNSGKNCIIEFEPTEQDLETADESRQSLSAKFSQV